MKEREQGDWLDRDEEDRRVTSPASGVAMNERVPHACVNKLIATS
jgi:hypothetical protein